MSPAIGRFLRGRHRWVMLVFRPFMLFLMLTKRTLYALFSAHFASKCSEFLESHYTRPSLEHVSLKFGVPKAPKTVTFNCLIIRILACTVVGKGGLKDCLSKVTLRALPMINIYN